jgi:hypothetical protein
VESVPDDGVLVPVPDLRQPEYRDEPRRGGGSFTCPFCESNSSPIVRSRVGDAGFVVLGIILVASVLLDIFTCGVGLLLAPLSLVGLAVREQHRVCSSCGITLG